MGLHVYKPDPEEWISTWPDVEFPCLVARVENVSFFADLTAFSSGGPGRTVELRLVIEINDEETLKLAEEIFYPRKSSGDFRDLLVRKFVRVAAYDPPREG